MFYGLYRSQAVDTCYGVKDRKESKIDPTIRVYFAICERHPIRPEISNIAADTLSRSFEVNALNNSDLNLKLLYTEQKKENLAEILRKKDEYHNLKL